jgi:hypothetical protein
MGSHEDQRQRARAGLSGAFLRCSAWIRSPGSRWRRLWSAKCLATVGAVLCVVSVACSTTPRGPVAADESAKQGESIARKYERKLIRRPGASPEDGKVYVVIDGKKRWVTHAEWIQAHGYKWPDDVQQIPASDLDAIPSGPPIEDRK